MTAFEEISRIQHQRMKMVDDMCHLILSHGWKPDECCIEYRVPSEPGVMSHTVIVVGGEPVYEVTVTIDPDIGSDSKIGVSVVPRVISPVIWHPRHPFKPVEGA